MEILEYYSLNLSNREDKSALFRILECTKGKMWNVSMSDMAHQSIPVYGMRYLVEKKIYSICGVQLYAVL